jgi:hypothetical protein
MSALPPIATAKADYRERSCPLCPLKRGPFYGTGYYGGGGLGLVLIIVLILVLLGKL